MKLEIKEGRTKVSVLLNGRVLRTYPRFSIGPVRFETGVRDAKALIRLLNRAERLKKR